MTDNKANELATLSLYPATEEQTLASRKRTFPQWGRGLTIEQYLTRDAQLDVQEHATGGKLTTWILAPRDNPQTLEFKCACETYQRKGLARLPGKDVEEVTGYGIASVYTPPENRGKGYARHMMRLLHWVLAPQDVLPPFPKLWGTPPPIAPQAGDARFSALYSDVGEFYSFAGPTEDSEGWTTRDPIGTVWDVPKDTTGTVSGGGHYLIKWLGENECKEIWKKDVELMHADLTKTESEKTLFTFLPDAGVGAFLVRRSDFFLPGLAEKIPSKWGVLIDSSNEEIRKTHSIPTFATWTVDVRPPPSTLIITRIRATDKTFPLLVSCLRAAARELNLEKVEVWNLPKDLEEAAHSLGGRTDTRDEHLNCFRWYGKERSDGVEWLFNEKFCWC